MFFKLNLIILKGVCEFFVRTGLRTQNASSNQLILKDRSDHLTLEVNAIEIVGKIDPEDLTIAAWACSQPSMHGEGFEPS